MNPDVKRRWVEALRSGEFAQGMGKLHREFIAPEVPDQLCCLGVLCVLAHRDGIVERRVGWQDVDSRSYEYSYNSNFLPDEVAEWAELGPTQDPTIEITRDAAVIPATLSDLNDDFGYNFERIAQIIEEQL